MIRLRDLGLTAGYLPVGRYNAITDVPGVRVGHTTLIRGEGALREGEGPIRTGVTAILPHSGNLFREKVSAGVQTINGFGKAIGFEQIRERGVIETPIILTNTLNIGLAADALIAYMLRDNPEIGTTTGTICPVVGECNDAFLSDIRGRHVREEHIWHAISSASEGFVVEGNVGAGTGTACYQFKGGIGTSSRVVLDGQFTVGALVQSNFGDRGELTFLGAPVGQRWLESNMPKPGPGSIMMVLATDAPLDSRQLRRLAMRATFGLARTGTTGHDGSGDFVIAFSTTNRWQHWPDAVVEQKSRFNEANTDINQLFAAAVESIEEAILNSLMAAQTMTGRDGNTLYAMPQDDLLKWMQHYRRIEE